MKTNSLINWAARREAVRMVRRFPVGILLLAGLAVKLFVDTSDSGTYHGIQPDRLHIFFLGGVIVSLVAALWFEDRLRGWKTHAAVAATTLLWGAYCYFGSPLMSNNYFLDSRWREVLGGIILFDMTVFPEIFIYSLLDPLMITAGAALLVFIPFWRKDSDTAFGNFFSRICIHFTLAYTINIFLKLMLLSTYKHYSTPEFIIVDIFCWVLFLPLWVMARIPDKSAGHDNKSGEHKLFKFFGLRFLMPHKNAKHDNKLGEYKLFKFFGLRVLMPLTVAYALVLYVFYLACLLMEDPLEYAAITVFILAAAGLLMIMLVYPSRLLEERRCKNNTCANWLPPSNEIAGLSRWFGVAILPLLILMTAAIIIRISEYGITILRGYFILINFWFYGIYAYLFFTKARSVKWIPISLGALLILASIGPWRVSNVTKHVLIADVSRAMNDPKLFFEYESEREILYYALGNFHRNRLSYLLDYVSDENSRKKVAGQTAYLFDTYVWKSKGEDESKLESYAVGDFTVRPTGKRNSVTIVGYAGNDTVLNIPSKLNGKGVAKIGKDAFAGKDIVRVTIPRGVTVIGDRAFMHNKLISVTIPKGVVAIGAEAFLANELAGVAIPGGVTAIGERAFAHNELSRAALPGSVTFIGEEAFAHNRLTSVAVPKRVTLIKEGAFADNQLTRVTIPNSVTAIGREAFARNRLTSVIIPRSVMFIAASAFADNEQEIALPKR